MNEFKGPSNPMGVGIADKVPVIGQPPRAIICMICESINAVDPVKPGQNQFMIVGETICPECRKRLKEILYPSTAKSATSIVSGGASSIKSEG